VGADILSAIDFPYPVVPIVRHHHENWDGTGYPAGIKGTSIPIGARILSVVDCYDALTSDRPYRPRLADAEALEILKERRGTMYDPMVVDTFFRFHSSAPDEIPRPGPPSDVLATIVRSRRSSPTDRATVTPDEISSSADEMLKVYESARSLAGHVSLGDAGDVIAKHLRRLVPSAVCVFYLWDRSSDELEARHVVGEASSEIRGLRIALGKRLSGWVAANRQSISNSDASLDLADAVKCHSPILRSCISTPMICDDELIGVLTLYSVDVQGFNDDHKRIVEAVARQIAHTFKSAMKYDETSRRDALTGLPNLQQLEQFIDTKGGDRVQTQKSAFTLLFIDVNGLKEINIRYGRTAGDNVLRHVVKHSTAGLRVADILFRCGSDELVALLNDTTVDAARSIGEGIQQAIRTTPVPQGDAISLHVEVTVNMASYPTDGDSLPALIEAAGARTYQTGVS
jgi:diguanylate cyclase (GGDEF)-like protein